jgi:hypothetical protein
MPLIGVFLRFSPSDDHTLIGHSVSDEAAFKGQKVMFVELVAYVLHTPETDEEQRWQEQEYYRKFRQLAVAIVKNHHGRPHWAKNETVVFQEARNDDAAYRARLHQFHCFVHRFDPANRLGNEFTAAVGLTPTQSEREKLGDCALPPE